ncbi:hypothetical protein AGMMS50239_08220 [Bacteroidia bacterium]|nr:hypothetical protein AGMMS50239_08220 [Bacteroidia bacterium]
MKRYFLSITVIAFLLLSCSHARQGDLLEIPIDIDQNNSLALSEIAEEITAIEMELTDESVINPQDIQRIIISENEVFIAPVKSILVFNKTGKFIRSIGSHGQGPGEYTGIDNIALDKKKRLIVSSNRKIIFYDLNGKFLKEKSFPDLPITDINYIGEELLLLVERVNSDSKGAYLRSILYQLNDELQLVDSCTIKDLYLEDSNYFYMCNYADYILKRNKSVYMYFYNGYVSIDRDYLAEKILRDTLYRFENNRLIPELKLKFKNDETGKFIYPQNIYRSSRYIFTVYYNANNPGKGYKFCYDTKTGKGYNMQGGYIDDINQIEDPVRIRPFNLDTEMFYYLHTNMKPGDLEEPNPTLYIGRLKK